LRSGGDESLRRRDRTFLVFNAMTYASFLVLPRFGVCIFFDAGVKRLIKRDFGAEPTYRPPRFGSRCVCEIRVTCSTCKSLTSTRACGSWEWPPGGYIACQPASSERVLELPTWLPPDHLSQPDSRADER
jgi:hypothetical protein